MIVKIALWLLLLTFLANATTYENIKSKFLSCYNSKCHSKQTQIPQQLQLNVTKCYNELFATIYRGSSYNSKAGTCSSKYCAGDNTCQGYWECNLPHLSLYPESR